MFQTIRTKNFKSIPQLEFEARKVNVFIGEPNSGKSNILEALALFSDGIYDAKVFKELFRFRRTQDLFFDREISRVVEISAGGFTASLRFNPQSKSFTGRIQRAKELLQECEFTPGGLRPYAPLKPLGLKVGYYRFRNFPRSGDPSPGSLIPPYGNNLVAVISSNKELRQRVVDLFRSKGYRFEIDPLEADLAIVKDTGEDLYRYPYESVSETLRRVVFFLAVIETNHGAVLLLDEPETNTFPFYTKHLAERIALDISNQFFITTHNPYILSSIVEKTKQSDLAIFVTRMEHFETKITRIPDAKLPELLELDSDAFFNLDKLVEG